MTALFSYLNMPVRSRITRKKQAEKTSKSAALSGHVTNRAKQPLFRTTCKSKQFRRFFLSCEKPSKSAAAHLPCHVLKLLIALIGHLPA